MQVTAKLSCEFYNRFGDELAEELVGLLLWSDSYLDADLEYPVV